MKATVRNYPLPAFFALALAITWAPVPFGVFMAAGPLIAAVAVAAVVDGRDGLRDLGRRMLHWRVGWRWYAAALLIPVTVVLGSGALNVALGAPDAPLRELELSALVMVFALRLVVPVFAPVGEEPGWRGFALPRLLAGRSPLGATLILAPLVTLWHVPLVFMASEDLAPVLLLATVAVTFFYTWLFVRTGGSVLITIVAHAAEGTIGPKLAGAGAWAGADETQWNLLYTGGWCAVAACLLVLEWQLWRARTQPRDEPIEVAGAPQPAMP